MYEDDNMSRPVSIPQDIVSNILTRLPVKTLTQFRSVSTQWNSTITHPSFSKSQYGAYPSMIATEKPVMVAFDVNREVFNFISLCDNDISNSEETILMELDGHLTIVDHQGLTSGEKNVIQMWVLTDVKDSKWVKKRVDIPAKYSEINDRLRFKFAGTT
ncbi:F-box domain containing protein [Tanacetum coccineum]|uniref:F-box domain containing protein n=1 Tax=Tanacetum coccineum TaxID=301880 RepID=A0ABQ5BFH8_9ASTR